MGFIQAIRDLGNVGHSSGLDAYLKLPLQQEGIFIRVHLDVEDSAATPLHVRGVLLLDAVHQDPHSDMKSKYLYRDRVGANVSWGFAPIYKMGCPRTAGRSAMPEWTGKGNPWQEDSQTHLYKIQNRLLRDYEKEGILSAGSTERIMADLEALLPPLLDAIRPGKSHLVIFGAGQSGEFVYPGQIPAFVAYFRMKLAQALGDSQAESRHCSLCGQVTTDYATLSHVFKFATTDKVNFLPGMDRDQENLNFAVCRPCLAKISAGRERVERLLCNQHLVPGLQIWMIPESNGQRGEDLAERVIAWLESQTGAVQRGKDQHAPQPWTFQDLDLLSEACVFHLVVWEKNNAQELLHLMLEDIPVQRLVCLENTWNRVLEAVPGVMPQKMNLYRALRILYLVLDTLACRVESDRIFLRDFYLKVLAALFKGAPLPVHKFKSIVASRSARMAQDQENWQNVNKCLSYAFVWTEYMQRINGGL